MIAIDTNILIYAHRRDSQWHSQARDRIKQLAEGRAMWAIPWPCLHEFLAIATHPRVFSPPTPLTDALEQVEAWMESPTLALLAETDIHWPSVKPLLLAGQIQGPQVHDARIAALCIQHGVRELWSADRDFSRFSALAVVNPMLGDRN